MPERRNLLIIDRVILFFMILFLATITNSIFLNQVGYYGALLTLIAKYFVTKSNPFKRTEIEPALLWFIAAEILSLIFSLNHSQALLFSLRRLLLMPLIYVTVAGTPDIKRAKLYFNTYIAAAVLTALVYIVFSYQYFIANLYNITQSGPSLFQYPITSSEILSITSVFLFAFLINEKGNLRNKLLTAAALLITLVALVATYKRTGWLGTGFGFFIIILLKKEWKYLIPLVILAVILLAVQKNESIVKIFRIEQSGLKELTSFNTDGRAFDITSLDGEYYISDYEKGLVKYKGSRALSNLETPSPIVSLEKWNGYLLGYFVDTRFISYKMDSLSTLNQLTECLPPGFTINHTVYGDYLYTMDNDSGLTIFKDPSRLERIYRNTAFNKFSKVFADSSLLLLFSPDSGLHVFDVIDGTPRKKLYSFHPVNVSSVFYSGHKFFCSSDKGVTIYTVGKDSVHYDRRLSGPETIYLWKKIQNNLLAADKRGRVYEIDPDPMPAVRLLGNPGYVPTSFTLHNDTLLTSFVHRSRILSVWDPYLPSNYVRLSLWKAGWEMFLDHPVFGVGDIDLAFLYKQYKSKYEKEIQGHMHNNFVHILVTLGIFGLLAFCYLLYRLFRIDLNIYRKMKNVPFASSYALGTIAALSTIVIAGLTEMNFFDHEIITLLWFTFGLNAAIYKRYYQKNS